MQNGNPPPVDAEDQVRAPIPAFDDVAAGGFMPWDDNELRVLRSVEPTIVADSHLLLCL